MTHLKELPPRDFLQACFDYDPKTGSLKWKKNRPVEHFAKPHLARRSNTRWGGKEVGNRNRQGCNGKPSGIRVNLVWNGEVCPFYAHRIIFSLMGVEVPRGMVIDHISGDAFDNRWSNLRLASHQENICNSAKRREGGKDFCGPLLPRGVFFNRKTYAFYAEVTLRKDGEVIRRYLGTFKCVNEAGEAYKKASKELHGDFARSH